MTDQQKIAWRDRFFRRTGRNALSFKSLFDALPNVLFHIVDHDERMVAMTPLCLENCNVRRELDIVGESIADFFPPLLADVFIARDREVLDTGRPIVNRIYAHRADRSTTMRAMNVWPLFDDARGRIIGTAAAYTNVESPESRPSWYDAIKGVVAHSDMHYMDNLSLAGLARIAGVSETRFRRLFLNVSGTGPPRA